MECDGVVRNGSGPRPSALSWSDGESLELRGRAETIIQGHENLALRRARPRKRCSQLKRIGSAQAMRTQQPNSGRPQLLRWSYLVTRSAQVAKQCEHGRLSFHVDHAFAT